MCSRTENYLNLSVFKLHSASTSGKGQTFCPVSLPSLFFSVIYIWYWYNCIVFFVFVWLSYCKVILNFVCPCFFFMLFSSAWLHRKLTLKCGKKKNRCIEPYLVTESFNLSCIVADFELSSKESHKGCQTKHKVMPFNTYACILLLKMRKKRIFVDCNLCR